MEFNFTKNDYGEKFNDHLLEEYKLYVEMADRVSQRRMNANSFFLSVNTLLISFLTLFIKRKGNGDFALWIICAITGLVACCTWFYILKSYRQLNSGKFQVIHLMEDKLPISPYDAEWDVLGKGQDRTRYWPLTHIEVILPLVFAMIYVALYVCTLL